MRVAIRPGSPTDKDLEYAVNDYEPGVGLTRDSHTLRFTVAAPIGCAGAGSCLS